MGKHILIVGGAGFIGSHLADDLLAHGHRVRVLDSLSPQVHGEDARAPAYLSADVEFIHGDVRRPKDVAFALEGVDVVYHFAALVGVGQSMYDVARYQEVNNVGTAVLLEALTKNPVERLVVASSMSIYGEGLYRGPSGRVRPGREREDARLRAGEWEVHDPETGEPLQPVPTPEDKPPALPSIYALTKYDQEIACLRLGRAYGIPTVALRFFNVFGTRQSLANPYTGVLAIFAARYLHDKAPLINEDGQQRRDFVSVHDVTQACRLAMERDAAVGQAFNVGSGRNYSILEVAGLLARALDKEHLTPQLTGKYRAGDIRHCFADITAAREKLGYAPAYPLETSLGPLAEWIAAQEGRVPADRVEQAYAELASRGLAV